MRKSFLALTVFFSVLVFVHLQTHVYALESKDYAITDFQHIQERFKDDVFTWSAPLPDLSYSIRFYTGEVLSSENIRQKKAVGEEKICNIYKDCTGSIFNTASGSGLLLFNTGIHRDLREKGGTIYLEYFSKNHPNAFSNTAYIPPHSHQDSASSFTDIEFSGYRDSIEYLYDKQIIKGRTPEAYVPGAYIPRAEALALLLRTFFPKENWENHATNFKVQHPTYTYAYFKDVSIHEWYQGYVVYAKEHNLIKGRSPTMFEPSANISDQEFLKLVFNMLIIKIQSEDSDAETNSEASPFYIPNGQLYLEWFHSLNEDFKEALYFSSLIIPYTHINRDIALTREKAAYFLSYILKQNELDHWYQDL
ncbi:MAG: S-layer homology domain-containing protein [Candidatus Gracilibacteria bacterium]